MSERTSKVAGARRARTYGPVARSGSDALEAIGAGLLLVALAVLATALLPIPPGGAR